MLKIGGVQSTELTVDLHSDQADILSASFCLFELSLALLSLVHLSLVDPSLHRWSLQCILGFSLADILGLPRDFVR